MGLFGIKDEMRKALADQKAREEAANVAAGLNADGSPKRPEFQSQLGEDGLMPDQYKMDASKYSYDPAKYSAVLGDKADLSKYTAGQVDVGGLKGMGALEKEAMREGPSKWAELQKAQSEMQRQSGVDDALSQQQSRLADAESAMAMRGGMGAGSRERMATSMGRGGLAAQQEQQRAAMQRSLGIDVADESTRQKALGQFAGMEADLGRFNVGQSNQAGMFNVGAENELMARNLAEQQRAGMYNVGEQNALQKSMANAKAKADQYNIEQALKEKNLGRASEMDVYKEQLSKWGGKKEAEATAGGGGK